MSGFNISVVIPVYNRADRIDRPLQSVLSQTLPAYEIIVVDDGSTDDIKNRIKNNYPEINLIQQENRGVSAARNAGILAAKGNWICFLDSDDSWQADKLQRQFEALQQQPEYRLCHTNETWYRNGQVFPQKKKHEKKGGNIFQRCLPLCVVSPSSVMLQKTLFEEIGLFDENLPACEDYDLWLRICCRYPVLFIDKPLTNKYGGHADQLSRKYWGMDRFRIIALQKCIESEQLNDVERQAAINMLLHKINTFLKGTEKHGTNNYVEQFSMLKQRYK